MLTLEKLRNTQTVEIPFTITCIIKAIDFDYDYSGSKRKEKQTRDCWNLFIDL